MSRTSKAESERVRLAILRATTEELADHGYAGLRVPAVAQRIGKTHGAVYGRFPNKEALALGAIRHLRDELLLPRVMVAVTEAGSAIASVEKVSATIAQIADEYPKGQLMVSRLASEFAGQKGAVADEVKSLIETFARVLQQLFEKARADGELHESVEPASFAYAVVGLPFAFATMSTMFPEAARYVEMEAALSRVLTRGITSND